MANVAGTFLHDRSICRGARWLAELLIESDLCFDGEKLGTAELSIIFKLNQEYGGKKSNLVAPRGIEPRFRP